MRSGSLHTQNVSGSASNADRSRQCFSRPGLQPEVGPCPTAPPL